jgi:hypothetical protein
MTVWAYYSRMFVIYGGISLFCINFFGSMMKIIIFSTVRTYRNTPGTFLMLISACIGCIQLLNASILTRVLATGFNINLAGSSVVWCKIHEYFYVTCPVLATNYDWLVTFDQFLVTSRSARLRNWSRIKVVRRIVIGILLFWFLTSIPYIFYTDVV